MREIDRQIFEAAREGYAARVTELVAGGASVDARHPAYCDHGAFLVDFTPLMWAAASPRSNAATVRALLSAGSDVFTVSAGEVTALFYAAGGVTHYPPTPEYLSKLPPDHPFLDWGGGDAERLRLILDAGANPSEFANNGRTSVGEAASIGDPERLRLLIERGASVWPVPAKNRARWPKEFEIPELERDRTNEQFETYAVPLFQAAQSGSADCVQLILEAGFPADFICQGENALDHAASVEVVEALWNAGARMGPGRFSFDAVDEAFEDEKYAVAQFLIDQFPDSERAHYINEKLMTCSGVRMNPHAVRILLGMGADPNYLSKDLGTPLTWCCWQGDGNGGRENEVVLETLGILLEAGADVNKGTRRGLYPIHEAVDGDWGSPSSVRVLIEHGADLNVRDEGGNTALMLAANRGEVRCISLLLAAGADRTLRNKRKKTALDTAQDHMKVWKGIVKRPPKMVSKFMKKIGIDHEAMAESHQKALAEAEEAVKLLSES